ncbi:hypothetical protein POG22_09440 [Geitlerinema sp. CS-897]|uniref:alr0857 family protein n=1 Tax=Baaleninema simplex TaxID=2862350 RepID=UPI00034AEC70|nr:alr0857 family protein [Baaleninema simplex]MDC0833227.1 hypothetical protein [Geitlerinema sp. CS-897]
MLKLTYTETNLHLEYLASSPEELVSRRVKLAMRTGTPLCVEPSQASFLLPVGLPGLQQLAETARREGVDSLELYPADEDFVEVSLRGTWVATDADTAEGLFVTSLTPFCETAIAKLWKAAAIDASYVRD